MGQLICGKPKLSHKQFECLNGKNRGYASSSNVQIHARFSSAAWAGTLNKYRKIKYPVLIFAVHSK